MLYIDLYINNKQYKHHIVYCLCRVLCTMSIVYTGKLTWQWYGFCRPGNGTVFAIILFIIYGRPAGSNI